jgi:hypothetical protein
VAQEVEYESTKVDLTRRAVPGDPQPAAEVQAVPTLSRPQTGTHSPCSTAAASRRSPTPVAPPGMRPRASSMPSRDSAAPPRSVATPRAGTLGLLRAARARSVCPLRTIPGPRRWQGRVITGLMATHKVLWHLPCSRFGWIQVNPAQAETTTSC